MLPRPYLNTSEAAVARLPSRISGASQMGLLAPPPVVEDTPCWASSKILLAANHWTKKGVCLERWQQAMKGSKQQQPQAVSPAQVEIRNLDHPVLVHQLQQAQAEGGRHMLRSLPARRTDTGFNGASKAAAHNSQNAPCWET